MPIDFDIAGARKAGATDADIAEYFKTKYTIDFDFEAARKAGATDEFIMGYINEKYPNGTKPAQQPASTPTTPTVKTPAFPTTATAANQAYGQPKATPVMQPFNAEQVKAAIGKSTQGINQPQVPVIPKINVTATPGSKGDKAIKAVENENRVGKYVETLNQANQTYESLMAEYEPIESEMKAIGVALANNPTPEAAARYEELAALANSIAEKINQTIGGAKIVEAGLRNADQLVQANKEENFNFGKKANVAVSQTANNLVNSTGKIIESIGDHLYNNYVANANQASGVEYTPDDDNKITDVIARDIDDYYKQINAATQQKVPESYSKYSPLTDKPEADKLLYFGMNAMAQLVPTVAAGITTGGAGAAAMGFTMEFGGMYDTFHEPIKQKYISQGLSEKEAELKADQEAALMAAGGGLLIAQLDKFGAMQLINSVGKKALVKKVTTEALQELGEKTGKEAVEATMKKVLTKNLVEFAKGYGKAVGGEATTEPLQELVAPLEQDIYNTVTDSETFTEGGLGDSQTWINAGNAGVGALMASSPGGLISGGRNIVPVQGYRKIRSIANEQELDKFQENLQGEVEAGVTTPKQAEEAMQTVQRVQEIDKLIPDNIQDDLLRTQAVNLINEKQELEAETEGKEKALIVPQVERIKQIDQQLTDIATGKAIEELENLKENEEETIKEIPTGGETNTDKVNRPEQTVNDSPEADGGQVVLPESGSGEKLVESDTKVKQEKPNLTLRGENLNKKVRFKEAKPEDISKSLNDLLSDDDKIFPSIIKDNLRGQKVDNRISEIYSLKFKVSDNSVKTNTVKASVLLSEALARSSSREESALIENILKRISKNDVDVSVAIPTEEYKNAGAVYSMGTNSIEMHPESLTSESRFRKVLLHEAVHALTLKHRGYIDPELDTDRYSVSESAPEDAKKYLVKIVDLYNDALTFVSKSNYGITNVDEFMAEALSNPFFQRELRSRNLWERFVNAIKDLLGLPVSNKMLEDILDATYSYIDSQEDTAPQGFDKKVPSKDSIDNEKRNTELIQEAIDKLIKKGTPINQAISSVKEKLSGILDVSEINWKSFKETTPDQQTEGTDNEKENNKGNQRNEGLLTEGGTDKTVPPVSTNQKENLEEPKKEIENLERIAKEKGIESFRKLVNIVNKYERAVSVGEEGSITEVEIESALKNREAGKVRDGYVPPVSAKKESDEGKKETGRSKSYSEKRVPVNDQYREEIDRNKVFYQEEGLLEFADKAIEYLSQFGDTVPGLRKAALEMNAIYDNNPYKDSYNSIAIELLSDRMFDKAMQADKDGDYELRDEFLLASNNLRVKAFLAANKAGKYNAALAVFSRARNPDAFLMFANKQIEEAVEKVPEAKKKKVTEKVKEFKKTVKQAKKEAIDQVVKGAPKKTYPKKENKFSELKERGLKRQKDALDKLGKLGFFGSSGMSNETIEAIGELVLSQLEIGIYKAASILQRIKAMTDGKVNDEHLKEVYEQYRASYDGKEYTLKELSEKLIQERKEAQLASMDINEALEKEREKQAKLKAKAEAKESSDREKAIAKVKLNASKKIVTEAEKLQAELAKERARIAELKAKEDIAQKERIEKERLSRVQKEQEANLKESEKKEKQELSDKKKLVSELDKAREKAKAIREKEAQEQSDRIERERLKRSQNAIKEAEQRIKGLNKKVSELLKTEDGKQLSLNELIQRDLEADLTAEAMAENFVTELGISEAEAKRLSELFYNQYKRALREKINVALNKSLGVKDVKDIESKENDGEIKPYEKTIGGRITDEVLAGALDSGETISNAFAMKYNIPVMTPTVAANIRALAKKAKAAKTVLGQRTANKNLVAYMQKNMPVNVGSVLGAMYYTSLLSGVSTAFVNTWGNTQTLLNQNAENVIQSVMEAVQGNPANLISTVSGKKRVARALNNFYRSMTIFTDVMQYGGGENKYYNLNQKSIDKFDAERLVVGKDDFKNLGFKKLMKTIFKLYKTPPVLITRNLPASDEAFFSANYNMEATRESRKKLYEKGLRGAALESATLQQVYGTPAIQMQAIQDAEQELINIGLVPSEHKKLLKRISYELITKNLEKEIQETAEAVANENTYRGALRGGMGAIGATIPQNAILAPFVNTVVKIAEKLLNYVPIYGAARYVGWSTTDSARAIGNSLGATGLDKWFERKGIEKAQRSGELRNKQLAQVILSHTLLLTIWALSKIGFDDDDNPATPDVPLIEVSAGYSGNRYTEKQKGKELMPEYSIRIGNTTLSYKQNPLLAMVALPLGVIDDIERMSKDMPDFGGKFFAYEVALATYLYDATPIKNIQEFFASIGKAMSDEGELNPEDLAKTVARSFAQIPANLAIDNTYKQVFDFANPQKYETIEYQDAIWKAINMEKIGGLVPTHDYWGRPVKFYPGESFYPLQDVTKNEEDKEVTRWAVKNKVSLPSLTRRMLVLDMTGERLYTKRDWEKKIFKQAEEDKEFMSATGYEIATETNYRELSYQEWADMDAAVRQSVYNTINQNLTKVTSTEENPDGSPKYPVPFNQLTPKQSQEVISELFEKARLKYLQDKYLPKEE